MYQFLIFDLRELTPLLGLLSRPATAGAGCILLGVEVGRHVLVLLNHQTNLVFQTLIKKLPLYDNSSRWSKVTCMLTGNSLGIWSQCIGLQLPRSMT